MTKSVYPKGRKLKNVSDPKQAHAHKAGTKIYFMQTAVDNRWGRYLFNQYYRYPLIFKKGLLHYKYALKALKKCRKLPIDKGNFRTLPLNLRDQLEINTMLFLMLTKLGFQYLVTEYEAPLKQIKKYRKEVFEIPPDTDDLTNRLRALAKGVGVTRGIPSKLHIICDRRDIVEHPTVDRLRNGTDIGWKTVNLSWSLSGEIENIMNEVINYVNEFVKKAEEYIKNNPVPGELKVSHRGLVAGEPYKKPIT